MRIERAIRVGWETPTEYVLGVDVPDGPCLDDVLAAMANLDRAEELVRIADGTCLGCRTRPHAFHQPECPRAPEGIIEAARLLAIEEGMRP